jgi:hypothetical protein
MFPMRHDLLLAAALLALPASLAAQNLVPEGDFEQGGATWTLMSFNDPAGTTGFGPARVLDQGPSSAIYASFQTLTSVRSATYRSQPLTIPTSSAPVGFAVLWDKQTTTPIPSPSVNRVEMRILDVNLALVTTFTLQSPNQNGLQERAVFRGTLNASPGVYTIELFLRHSNLAGIPFDCWVDDVYVGAPAVSFFGQGCAGSGGFMPRLHTNGTPRVGAANFELRYHDGWANGVALCAFGLSNTTLPGGSLPLPLGGGCDLLVEPMFAFGQPVAGTGPGDGTAAFPLPIPADVGLVGSTLYTQWLGIDPAAPNPFALAVTAGMRVQIQP